MTELSIISEGSLLLILFPECGDLIISALTNSAFPRIAHTLDSPEGAFIMHV